MKHYYPNLNKVLNKDVFETIRISNERAEKETLLPDEIVERLEELFGIDISSSKYSFDLYEDQDRGYHFVLIENEREDSFKRTFNEFYSNFFGVGETCRITTLLERHHAICNISENITGINPIRVDFMTVLSFMKVAYHSSNLYLMRLMCDWLYAIDME